MQIHPVHPQMQTAEVDLGAGAHQHGGMVDLDLTHILGGLVHIPIRPRDARSHAGELHIGRREVQAQTVEVGNGQGQRGEAGPQPVPYNGAVAPSSITVAGNRHVGEYQLPGGPVLEELAAPALQRLASLDPVEQIVPGPQVIPHQVVEGLRAVEAEGDAAPLLRSHRAQRPGVVRVLGEGVVDEVAVERALVTQVRPRCRHLFHGRMPGRFLRFRGPSREHQKAQVPVQ